MKDELLSVIIPAYNLEDYIEEPTEEEETVEYLDEEAEREAAMQE